MPPTIRSTIGLLALAACLGLATALFSQSRAWSAGEIEQGRRVYFGACVACHGSDGAGAMPDVSDFGDATGPLSKKDIQLLKSILEGVGNVNGSSSMPPKGGNPELTEEDARNVLEFIRGEFGPTCPNGLRCDATTKE